MGLQDLKDRICGVVIAMITPCNADQSLDAGGMRADVAHAVEAGIANGRGVLLICGGGGELPFLTVEERAAAVQAAAEAAAGRVPILAGLQDNGTALSVDIARRLQDAGADALQVGPPCFYGHSPIDDTERYYAALAAAVHIGLVAYNTWWTTTALSPADLVRLSAIEELVAVKWSAADSVEYQRGYRLCAERYAMIDNQEMFALACTLGARGFISGTGDFWPEYDLQRLDLVLAGRYEEAEQLTRRLAWPYYQFRGRVGARTGGEASVKKAAAELVGLAGGPPRSPTRPLTEDERAELREILQAGGTPGLR